MIKYIPLMLNRQSPTFLEFFDDISYKPLSMQKVLVIPCNEELPSEYLFKSNTSLITKDLVLDKFEDAGLIKHRDKKSYETNKITDDDKVQQER